MKNKIKNRSFITHQVPFIDPFTVIPRPNIKEVEGMEDNRLKWELRGSHFRPFLQSQKRLPSLYVIWIYDRSTTNITCHSLYISTKTHDLTKIPGVTLLTSIRFILQFSIELNHLQSKRWLNEIGYCMLNEFIIHKQRGWAAYLCTIYSKSLPFSGCGVEIIFNGILWFMCLGLWRSLQDLWRSSGDL